MLPTIEAVTVCVGYGDAPTKSRGGRPSIEMVGRSFGRWTVLRLSHVGKHRCRYWWCRCLCGHEQVVAGNMLRAGESNGCRRCKASRQQKTAYTRYWAAVVSNAARRGISVEVTAEEAFALLGDQGGVCALTGQPIEIASSGRGHIRGETTASLDRIDPSRGYVCGNIQWLHKRVNQMKWDLTQDEFINFCKVVADRHAT